MNPRDGSLSKPSTLRKGCSERVGERGKRKEKKKGEKERRVEEIKCDLTKKKEAIKTHINAPIGSLRNSSLNFCISKCAVV